jgi:hypothetical protein
MALWKVKKAMRPASDGGNLHDVLGKGDVEAGEGMEEGGEGHGVLAEVVRAGSIGLGSADVAPFLTKP